MKILRPVIGVMLLCSCLLAGSYVDPVSALPKAKALGMGNAYTAIGKDIFSGYFNPAGLSEIKNYEFSLINTSTFADINLTGLAVAYNLGNSFGKPQDVVYFGYTLCSAGSIKNMQYSGTDIIEAGKLDAKNQAIALGYSKKIGEKVGVGFMLNTFHNTMDSSTDSNSSYDGSGLSYDLGMNYQLTEMLALGAVYKNLGGNSVGYAQDISDEIKQSSQVGISYRVPNTMLFIKDMTVALDYEKLNNGAKTGLFHIGTEISVLTNLVARGGLDEIPVSNGVGDITKELNYSLGLGFVLSGFSLDYAFYPRFGEGENKHFISMAYAQ